MALDYKSLPVYEQKEKILEALKDNQVIVVQSPTGSGKTTQLPVILHEAGYDSTGMIAVTSGSVRPRAPAGPLRSPPRLSRPAGRIGYCPSGCRRR